MSERDSFVVELTQAELSFLQNVVASARGTVRSVGVESPSVQALFDSVLEKFWTASEGKQSWKSIG